MAEQEGIEQEQEQENTKTPTEAVSETNPTKSEAQVAHDFIFGATTTPSEVDLSKFILS